jgi:hypothetical protein
MQPTPKPRDIRTQPLTTRERDTNFYASKFRRLGEALDRFSARTEQSMHDRSIAASRADVYLRIATLFDDLTLIDEAGRIGVEPARQGAPPLPSKRDRTAPKPVFFH